MENKVSEADRIELMQGTLDMLILRTLVFGPAHGHEIAKHIQRTTDDVLQVEHGSLYPALHRLSGKVYSRRSGRCPKTGSASSSITGSRQPAKSSLPRSNPNGGCWWPPLEG